MGIILDSKFKTKQDEYFEKKKETALAKGKPQIEKVTQFEVYLVKDGGRDRRICGSKKRGIPAEYPCLSHAGSGTNHLGVGYCVTHDPKCALDDKYWRKLNTSMGVPVDIQELYENTTDLQKTQLFSLSNVMQRTTILYWDIMQHPESENKETGENEFSHWQRQELRKLDRQMIDIIESERKLDNQGRLKGATINSFLDAFFGIITSTLDANKAKLLMNRLMKVTYTQHDAGNITGDLQDFEKKIVKFEMEIKDKEDKEDREIVIEDVEVINEKKEKI